MKHQIKTEIKEGKINNPKVIREAFDSLDDGIYSLTIERSKKRSLQQSAYYWGCCVPLVKEGLRNMGFNEVKSNDDAHLVMKHLFLKKKIVSEVTGDEIIVETSTTTLSKEAFNFFLEEVWQWASSYLNIQIPQPNEQISLL